MKLLVLGAAGKTGEAIVEQAVAAGHQVTAFVHTPDKFHRTDVLVFSGDARDQGVVLDAIRGQDAVIDALGGHLPFLNSNLETDTAKAVIEAMREAGVRRLLVISTIGEGSSASNVHDFYKHFFMSTVLRGVMADKATMEAAVEHSDLDWTIVRPAGLKDGPPTGFHIVQPDAEHPEQAEKVRFITRTDVAAFLIQQLTSREYLHQAVGIAGPHD